MIAYTVELRFVPKARHAVALNVTLDVKRVKSVQGRKDESKRSEWGAGWKAHSARTL